MSNRFRLRAEGNSCLPNLLQRQQPLQWRIAMPAKIATRPITRTIYSRLILPYANSQKNKVHEQIPNPIPIPRASLNQSWLHQYLSAGIQMRTSEKPSKIGMRTEMTT